MKLNFPCPQRIGLLFFLLSFPLCLLAQTKPELTASEVKSLAEVEFKKQSSRKILDRYNESWQTFATQMQIHQPEDSPTINEEYTRLKSLLTKLKTDRRANIFLYTDPSSVAANDFSSSFSVIIHPTTQERKLIIERKVLKNQQFTDEILLAILAHELSHDAEDGYLKSTSRTALKKRRIFAKTLLVSKMYEELQTQTDRKAVDLLELSGFSGQLVANLLELFLTMPLPKKARLDVQHRLSVLTEYLESKPRFIPCSYAGVFF